MLGLHRMREIKLVLFVASMKTDKQFLAEESNGE
jgi:hypothetical protein